MWVLLIWANCRNPLKGSCGQLTSPSPIRLWAKRRLPHVSMDMFCVPGRMTCWTWRPCFRRTPGWVARSSSRENLRGLSSPYLKSPGTSMWMDTSPNLTEKRWRSDSLGNHHWKNKPLDIWQMVTLKVVAGFHQKTLFDWELRRENPCYLLFS